MPKEKPKRRSRRKTARIYYAGKTRTGQRLWWTVKVTQARTPVVINGDLLHALRGERGTTIGCMMSNCTLHNSSAFPHPVELAAFTKSTALVITKITNGQPSHAVRYDHSYGDLIEKNDKGYLKVHPELAEREFTLRPPRTMRGTGRIHTVTHKAPYHMRAVVAKGALKRAIDAGLVTPGLAKQGFK